MMCTMQNHIIQVFANSGNVIKPIGVLNELKSKWLSVDLKHRSYFTKCLPEPNDTEALVWLFTFLILEGNFLVGVCSFC